jgi:hypothetical protein
MERDPVAETLHVQSPQNMASVYLSSLTVTCYQKHEIRWKNFLVRWQSSSMAYFNDDDDDDDDDNDCNYTIVLLKIYSTFLHVFNNIFH